MRRERKSDVRDKERREERAWRIRGDGAWNVISGGQRRGRNLEKVLGKDDI